MSIEELKFFPPFIAFIREIEEMKEDYRGVVSASGSIKKIFRAQGSIEAIDRILDKADGTGLEEDTSE
jgi:hypothetical protein